MRETNPSPEAKPELRCCDEAEHEALLADLAHDALVDPDIRRIIYRARRLLLPPPAPTSWWAK